MRVIPLPLILGPKSSGTRNAAAASCGFLRLLLPGSFGDSVAHLVLVLVSLSLVCMPSNFSMPIICTSSRLPLCSARHLICGFRFLRFCGLAVSTGGLWQVLGVPPSMGKGSFPAAMETTVGQNINCLSTAPVPVPVPGRRVTLLRLAGRDHPVNLPGILGLSLGSYSLKVNC